VQYTKYCMAVFVQLLFRVCIVLICVCVCRAAAAGDRDNVGGL